MSSNKYVIILIISVIAIGLIAGILIKFLTPKNMFKIQPDKKISEEKEVREPAVAEAFYPGLDNELNAIIDDYLGQVELPKYEGVPQIIIVPHAGYIYSGRVAAYGFKTLENTSFKRVIIIGRSHTAYFDGVVTDSNDAWETPLGKVEVDQEFIDLLKKTTDIVAVNKDYHKDEHSLEVEVPFLQKVLGNDIKIVPLLFGGDGQEAVEELAESLSKLIDQETVVVISSDLSHYPAYEDANRLDKQVVEAVITGDVDQFTSKVRELEAQGVAGVATLACGEVAIASGMELAKSLGLKPVFLKYANSGDYEVGSKDRVVGYAAIAFVNPSVSSLSEDIEKRELNEQEQKVALEIARKTLESAFAKKDYKPDVSAYPIFQVKRGAFVTLKKQGELRGCIGNFEPEQSLVEVTRAMAMSAAFNDPRFTPLKADELAECEIEISVLSPREKIFDPNIIEVGRHGVYVQKGMRSGVYLPQVATEQGWNREQFLNHLCEYKAGIDPEDCWSGDVDLYVFTAQVFGE